MNRIRALLVALTTALATGMLLVAPSIPAGAVVPGANGRIVFVSDRDGNEEIYAMRSDGTGLVQLTTNTFQDYDPAVSGDGLSVAFISDRDGGVDLYTMNIDGTNVLRLTTDLGTIVESHPSWAPNKTGIVFAGLSGTDSEIYTIKPTGGAATNITNDATAFDANPAWSPGGIKIAFDSTNRAGSVGTDVYTMVNDGSGVIRLTTDGKSSNPSWFPDNKNITFQSARDAIEPGPSHFATISQPVGLAFTSSELLVTQLTKDKVLAVDDTGASSTFALLPSTGGANLERYIAVSPGLGGWPAGYVYVSVRKDILQITPDGSTVTTFTTIPNLPSSNITLEFDTVGTFGNDLLVAGGKRAFLYRVHSDGTFDLVKDLRSLADEFEAPEVAPLDWAPYGGQAIVSDKLDSKVWAIDSSGNATEVGTWPNADEVDFIPPTPCNYGTSGGAYFLAMRDQGEILKFPATDFTGVTGALVANETDTDIALFHSNGASIEISEFSPPIGSPELEGTDFAPCGSGSGAAQPVQAQVTGPNEIYKIDTVSRVQTRLTDNTIDDTNPAVSPNGLTITFQSDQDNPGIYEVYTMVAADGTAQTNITNNTTANDVTPDWQAVSFAVTVSDFVFSPATDRPKLGGSMYWDFSGPSDHTATDSSGMLLFDSGTKAAGTFYVFRFTGAGSYPYTCSLHPTLMNGTVKVPMSAAPKTGNLTTVFTITWATNAAPTGFNMDVQIQRPGTTDFVDWKINMTTVKSATFVADGGTGTYSFRARLQQTSTGFASDYSTPVAITVNP